MKWLAAAWLLWASPMPAAQVYHYWIEPCAADAAAHSACDKADPELARWALEAWQKAAGELQFLPAPSEDDARVRFYWLGSKPQLYGDTQTGFLNGKRVWIIEVQPDLSQFGPRIAAAGAKDRLFRDTVVYLTCLHEIGHVLALPHTADFADIMYSFQYGGDIFEYFNRYRRTLGARLDIRKHAGLSEADRLRVSRLYAGR